jgi:hypothetical protein
MKPKASVYESAIELLRNIIKDVFENEDIIVVLFGSRARDDYLETSDIDIGILPKGKMDKNKLTLLRERMENSNIPYKVDVVDLSQTSEEFTRKVLKEGVVIWKSYKDE